MKTHKNILGVHMEGPYLNPKYGAGKGVSSIPNRSEYMEYIKSGIIKQWTFSPEIEGTDAFLDDIKQAGIIPAIGHSAASPERVYEVCGNGVKIVTHLTNATGSSIAPPDYGGTIEISFDHAALLCDDLYYEIICDTQGVHVRHDIIRLIIKTVGVDQLVGITDACAGPGDDRDINMVDGELMGSKLTMQRVAQNFSRLGLNVCDIFKILSLNPARAIGLDNRLGSIEKGKTGSLLLTDNGFESIQTIFNGNLV